MQRQEVAGKHAVLDFKELVRAVQPNSGGFMHVPVCFLSAPTNMGVSTSHLASHWALVTGMDGGVHNPWLVAGGLA